MNKSAETAVFMAELNGGGYTIGGIRQAHCRPLALFTAQIGERTSILSPCGRAFGPFVATATRLTAERLAQTFRKASGGEDVLITTVLELVKQATRVFWPAD